MKCTKNDLKQLAKSKCKISLMPLFSVQFLTFPSVCFFINKPLNNHLSRQIMQYSVILNESNVRLDVNIIPKPWLKNWQIMNQFLIALSIHILFISSVNITPC